MKLEILLIADLTWVQRMEPGSSAKLGWELKYLANYLSSSLGVFYITKYINIGQIDSNRNYFLIIAVCVYF